MKSNEDWLGKQIDIDSKANITPVCICKQYFHYQPANCCIYCGKRKVATV